MGSNDFPDAQGRVSRLLEFHAQNPDDPFICHALGLEYFNARDFAASVKYFKSGLAADPGYVASYYHLGKSLESANQPDEAREAYTTGIRVASQHGDDHARKELQAALQLLTQSSTDD
jgi:tetratricopeptide (TPR) repeat protein